MISNNVIIGGICAVLCIAVAAIHVVPVLTRNEQRLSCADANGMTVQSPAFAEVRRDGMLWVMTDPNSGSEYVYVQRPGELCALDATSDGSR